MTKSHAETKHHEPQLPFNFASHPLVPFDCSRAKTCPEPRSPCISASHAPGSRAVAADRTTRRPAATSSPDSFSNLPDPVLQSPPTPAARLRQVGRLRESAPASNLCKAFAALSCRAAAHSSCRLGQQSTVPLCMGRRFDCPTINHTSKSVPFVLVPPFFHSPLRLGMANGPFPTSRPGCGVPCQSGSSPLPARWNRDPPRLSDQLSGSLRAPGLRLSTLTETVGALKLREVNSPTPGRLSLGPTISI